MEKAQAICRSISRISSIVFVAYIIAMMAIGGLVIYFDLSKPMAFDLLVIPGVLLLIPFVATLNMSNKANSYMWEIKLHETCRSSDEKTLAWIYRMMAMPREEWRSLEFTDRSVSLKIEGHELRQKAAPLLPSDLQLEEFAGLLHATRMAILDRRDKEAPPEMPASLIRWEKYVMRQAMA